MLSPTVGPLGNPETSLPSLLNKPTQENGSFLSHTVTKPNDSGCLNLHHAVQAESVNLDNENNPSGVVSSLKKTKSNISVSSSSVNVKEETTYHTCPNPILNFEDTESIALTYFKQKEKFESLPIFDSIADSRIDANQYRSISDLTEQNLLHLIAYQQNPPYDFIMGDAISFGPMTSSEFNECCDFLLAKLNRPLKRQLLLMQAQESTVIIALCLR